MDDISIKGGLPWSHDDKHQEGNYLARIVTEEEGVTMRGVMNSSRVVTHK